MAREAWAPWTFRLFAVIGAALFFASSLAVATDSDGDGIADDVEAYTARNMVAHETGDSFFIRSRSVGAAQDDVFEVSYARGEFAVSYAPRASAPESVWSVWYHLEFRRLVEYTRDENGELREISGTERDLTTEPAKVTIQNTTTLDGERQTRFKVEFLPTTAPGLLTVTVGASERFAKVDGGLVTPAEAKVDIEIRGWPFSQGATNLGVDVEMYTDVAVVPRVEDRSLDEDRGWASAEEQVNVTRDRNTAFFSWADTALVDGLSRPVQTTPLETSGEGYEFALVYDRGAVIVHDPKMGVESTALWSIWYEERPGVLRADPAMYVVGLAAIASVVAASVLIRRRRRKE